MGPAGRRVAGRRWLWVRRVVLTVFTILAVVVQIRMAQRGAATLPESLAVGVAVVGFVLLTWTRFQVPGTLVVLLSHLASAALPGSLNNGLWLLMLPLLVDANSRRPRWPGLATAGAMSVCAVLDWWGDMGSTISLLLYAWLLSLLGMFIRNRMENTLLAYGVECARLDASLRVARERAGRTVGPEDSMIAAICLAGGHALATRNTRHFTRIGLVLHDPWSAGGK